MPEVHNGGMNWMDDKLDERDRNKSVMGAATPETIQKHKDDLALAAKSWDGLAKEIKSDVAKWNARTPDQRLTVTATPETIGVFWVNAPLEVLEVSRKLNQTTARYGAPHPHKKHEGAIDLLRDDAERLSEELLSPVLFP